MLPSYNDFSSSMYEVNKSLNWVDMGYENIHACLNDCILYHNQYDNQNKCLICKESRWKWNANETNVKNRCPAKVFWYFSLRSYTISHQYVDFKECLKIKETSKMLT